MKKGKCDNFFSYGYDKSQLKGRKNTQALKDNNPFECCGL